MFCTKIQQPAVSHIFVLFDQYVTSFSHSMTLSLWYVPGTSGLAMSRSIGDWDAGEVGVIPDPLIDILDVKEIKRKILESLNASCNDNIEAVEIDPATGESKSTGVHVQAVLDIAVLLHSFPEHSVLFVLSFRLVHTLPVCLESRCFPAPSFSLVKLTCLFHFCALI